MEQSSLIAPVVWLADLATGQLAVVTATIAVAVVGLAMLDGRLDWRRGARVVLGCFLLFGAATVSSAFMTLGESVPPATENAIHETPSPVAQQPDNDPWAHAALEPRPLSED